MNALAAAERKEVPGVTPHADKYCDCDPGPVTPDCKAPQLDHWRLGQWLDVDSGVNSENDVANDRFALGQRDEVKYSGARCRRRLTRRAATTRCGRPPIA
ncbi:MAG: hypothetical protein JO223_00505 [Hyphomicrobiales bacterium]|nr:hypothetical protein [Hyphomicrobiales bacterium]